jgi:hypothetical protein
MLSCAVVCFDTSTSPVGSKGSTKEHHVAAAMLQQQLRTPNALQLIQQTTLNLTAAVRLPHAANSIAASCQPAM